MKRIVSVFSALCMLMLMFASLPMTVTAIGKGDFNGDGKFNSTDIREFMVMLAEDAVPTQQQLWWMDYDQSGTLDSTDAYLALKKAVKSTVAPDYTQIDTTGVFGEKDIAILGDSMSFGAGSSGDVAQNSYVGLIKQAVNTKTGYSNYGYTSVASRTWTVVEDYKQYEAYEVHDWPTFSKTFVEDEHGDRLGIYGLTLTELWSMMTFNLRDGYDYEYFCIYYHTDADNGVFTVENNGTSKVDSNGQQWFDCNNTASVTKRSGFFNMSDFSDGITIVAQTTDKPVTIMGIGYYNEIGGDAVTVNNFSRGGQQLAGDGSEGKGTSKTVLDQVAQSETLIFSLGYNDAHFALDRATFTDRIDYLIECVNKYDTKLIVNDLCWYIPGIEISGGFMDPDQIDFVKSELLRLACETGGMYIDQQAIHGDAIINTIYDGAHPTPEGHKLIADTILQMMGIA